MAFTPRQKRQLGRRTTPTSRERLAEKFRGVNKPSDGGAKPGLGKPPKSPAAPKPAAARPVGRSSQPDALYNNNVDLAERQGQARLDQLGSQEQAVKHDFGIEDPTNPFSRVEGLKRMFLQRYRGTSAGLAAQGHLYSGQHERALARTRRDEEEARAGLRKNYEGVIGQIGAAKAGVKFETEEQRMQAFEDWLARAPESEAPAETVSGPTGAAAQASPQFPAGSPNASGQAPTIVGNMSDAARAKAIPGLPKKGGGGGAKTRIRGGKKEYQWPNGSWHSRPHRGN